MFEFSSRWALSSHYDVLLRVRFLYFYILIFISDDPTSKGLLIAKQGSPSNLQPIAVWAIPFVSKTAWVRIRLYSKYSKYHIDDTFWVLPNALQPLEQQCWFGAGSIVENSTSPVPTPIVVTALHRNPLRKTTPATFSFISIYGIVPYHPFCCKPAAHSLPRELSLIWFVFEWSKTDNATASSSRRKRIEKRCATTATILRLHRLS